MGEALQTIAAYLHFNSGRLDKLQGKVMTHSEKVEWWIILMVDCVTLFLAATSSSRSDDVTLLVCLFTC